MSGGICITLSFVGEREIVCLYPPAPIADVTFSSLVIHPSVPSPDVAIIPLHFLYLVAAAVLYIVAFHSSSCFYIHSVYY